jgi:hypothetical protein
MEQPPQQRTGSIALGKSLLARARKNEQEAICTMFSQFLCPDEQLHFVCYLGTRGMWGFGSKSFACLTNRRICSLQVGAFGEIAFQDGYLEQSNSGLVYQPDLLSLYSMVAVYSILALIFTLGLGLLLLPLVVQFYYRYKKCGIVWVIKEGVSVYIFCNRSRLALANDLYRVAGEVREQRMVLFGSHN